MTVTWPNAAGVARGRPLAHMIGPENTSADRGCPVRPRAVRCLGTETRSVAIHPHAHNSWKNGYGIAVAGSHAMENTAPSCLPPHRRLCPCCRSHTSFDRGRRHPPSRPLRSSHDMCSCPYLLIAEETIILVRRPILRTCGEPFIGPALRPEPIHLNSRRSRRTGLRGSSLPCACHHQRDRPVASREPLPQRR